MNRDAVSKNDDVLPKDNNEMPKAFNLSNDCNKILKIEENFDDFDVSDSISVITESDTDSNNRISQVNDSFQINSIFQNRFRLPTLERQVRKHIMIIIALYYYIYLKLYLKHNIFKHFFF